ncbi:MAG: hypothetical protein Pg6B_05280 [Candidatus Azobacteroides pseudotrichonymphae]|nr:MAG: hypothetical protein Pg6B_05280 [Candidatus Azobacteroides pseudotrichonymphae]
MDIQLAFTKKQVNKRILSILEKANGINYDSALLILPFQYRVDHQNLILLIKKLFLSNYFMAFILFYDGFSKIQLFSCFISICIK